MSDAPFFIVGANRSGTTLLRLMLNAHSRLGVPEEMGYLNARIGGVPLARWQAPGWTEAGWSAFVRTFVTDSCRHLDGLRPEVLEREIARGERTLRQPYATALAAWARHHGKARWGEKTPGNLFYADVLHAWFPEARFVEIVRDPRAGVASLVRAPFCVDDAATNALNWHKHLTAGRARLRRVPAWARMTVRYEDLVADPTRELVRICSFLGEGFEPAMLGFHAEARAHMKPEAAAGYNAAATRPVTRTSVERWRQELTRHDQQVVERVCRAEMEALGYRRESEPLGPRRAAALAALSAYWHLQNLRNRARPHWTLQHAPFARPVGRAREAWRALRRLTPSPPAS
jgi:hypothetical protein